MSAAMFAAIKELKARVDVLEEKVLTLLPHKPELTQEQHAALDQHRHTIKLSLKKVL